MLLAGPHFMSSRSWFRAETISPAQKRIMSFCHFPGPRSSYGLAVTSSVRSGDINFCDTSSSLLHVRTQTSPRLTVAESARSLFEGDGSYLPSALFSARKTYLHHHHGRKLGIVLFIRGDTPQLLLESHWQWFHPV